MGQKASPRRNMYPVGLQGSLISTVVGNIAGVVVLVEPRWRVPEGVAMVHGCPKGVISRGGMGIQTRFHRRTGNHAGPLMGLKLSHGVRSGTVAPMFTGSSSTVTGAKRPIGMGSPGVRCLVHGINSC